MAIVDVVVIPVGTETSVSKYIAEIQTKLKSLKTKGKLIIN